jgi:hypothetical protein
LLKYSLICSFQVVQAIRKSDHNKKKLLAFIDQLVAVCLENDPQLLEGLPRCQLDPGLPLDQLKLLPHNKVRHHEKRAEL